MEIRFKHGSIFTPVRLMNAALYVTVLTQCSNPSSKGTSTANDFATNVKDSGRPYALSRYYTLELNGQSLELVRGVCSGNSTGIETPTWTDCSEGTDTNRVDLDTFLNTIRPGLANVLKSFSEADVNFSLRESASSYFSKIEGDLKDSHDLDFLKTSVINSQTENLNYLKRIAKENYGLLNLLYAIGERNSPPFVLDVKDLPETDKRIVAAVRNLDGTFEKAMKTKGIPCSKETVRFKSEDGGCLDHDTHLVWTPVYAKETIVDAAIWKSYPNAVGQCSQLGLGEKYDWRIPTTDEINTLVGEGSQSVKVYPDLYYWTTTANYMDGVFEKSHDLEVSDEPVLEKDTHILLGYNSSSIDSAESWSRKYSWDKSNLREKSHSHRSGSKETESNDHYAYSDAVYGVRSESMKELSRVLKSKFHYRMDVHKLFKLKTSSTFDLKEHSFLFAEGEILKKLEHTIRSPVASVKTSEYSSFYNEKKGHSESFDGNVYGTVNGSGANFGRRKSKETNQESETESVQTSSVSVKLYGYDRYREILDRSEKVDPLRYVEYELPPDVNKDEIALVCVRELK